MEQFLYCTKIQLKPSFGEELVLSRGCISQNGAMVDVQKYSFKGNNQFISIKNNLSLTMAIELSS